MEISRSDSNQTFTLALSATEMNLLIAYLYEAAYAQIPSELYVRTGGSQQNLLAVLDHFKKVAYGGDMSASVELLLGVDDVEFPKKPRH